MTKKQKNEVTKICNESGIRDKKWRDFNHSILILFQPKTLLTIPESALFAKLW